MEYEFTRTELLLGSEGMKKLKNSRVAIFGLGGVGGHCGEALVRSGIENLDVFDSDTISVSNINRQIIATTKTIGLKKVQVFKERMLEINPKVNIRTYDLFYGSDNKDNFPYNEYDYIVDAIDTISSKIILAEIAEKFNLPIMSSMGAGNKLDPTKFQVTDIYKTSVCPLAKVMRYELRKRNIKKLKVVYSKELPIKPQANNKEERKPIPGSTAFVPSVAGLIIASCVVRDLCQIEY